MSHSVTESINRRKREAAARLREMKRYHLQYPVDIETLETAALLCEQSSANRFKKAVHSLRESQGMWVRRLTSEGVR